MWMSLRKITKSCQYQDKLQQCCCNKWFPSAELFRLREMYFIKKNRYEISPSPDIDNCKDTKQETNFDISKVLTSPWWHLGNIRFQGLRIWTVIILYLKVLVTLRSRDSLTIKAWDRGVTNDKFMIYHLISSCKSHIIQQDSTDNNTFSSLPEERWTSSFLLTGSRIHKNF